MAYNARNTDGPALPSSLEQGCEVLSLDQSIDEGEYVRALMDEAVRLHMLPIVLGHTTLWPEAAQVRSGLLGRYVLVGMQ